MQSKAGGNGPPARWGGLPARRVGCAWHAPSGGCVLVPKLGGKLPPRTARLAVPPGTDRMVPAQPGTFGFAQTPNPLNAVKAQGTSFTDTAASGANLTYQIRACKLQASGSGSFWNLSQGTIITVP